MKKLCFLALCAGVFMCLSGVSERLILTLPEVSKHASLRTWLEKTRPGGVMLLASHVANREKTRELCAFLRSEARKYTKTPLLIGIDWEGGIVSRPSELGGFASIPSPWALAQNGPQAAYKAGFLIGSQMRSVGIDLNFAPSLDLYGKMVLGSRCFSADPEVVAKCGKAFCDGLVMAGVTPVLKHFPGLGAAVADTHHQATSVPARPQDKQPFDTILAQRNFPVMVTHASVSRIDADSPLTRSEKAVNWLRTLYPHAPLITDDMMMRAAGDAKNELDSLCDALCAGYDYVIYSADFEKQIRLVDQLNKKINSDDLTLKRNIIKQLHPQASIPLEDEQGVAQHIARLCLFAGLLPKDLSLHGKKIVMVTSNIARIRPPERWFVLDGKSYLASRFEKYGLVLDDELVLDPQSDESAAQLSELLRLNRSKTDVVYIVQTLFYANNKWNDRQEQWLKLFEKNQLQVVTVSLGFDYESTILPDAQHVRLGSFHKPLLEVLAQELALVQAQAGADKLVANPTKYLAGKRFGLLANHASYDSQGRFLPDTLAAWLRNDKSGAELVALFAPEHGFAGDHEAFGHVHDESASRWGCPIYSLHGKTKKPTPEMLKNVDLLVVDLPDIGMRCFTYLSTLDLALQACAEEEIPVLVLDRFNPLLVHGPQGPLLEDDCHSFVGRIKTQFMHGATIGAIAQQSALEHGAQCSVLMCDGGGVYTGLRSYRTVSPNLQTFENLLAYPITVFFEGTNYSEGRGTEEPFIIFGAPHVKPHLLAKRLNGLKIRGLVFEPHVFTPIQIKGKAENPKHKNKRCGGVRMHIMNPELISPYQAAQAILKEVFTLYSDNTQAILWGKQHGLDLLAGTKKLRADLMQEVYKEQTPVL